MVYLKNVVNGNNLNLIIRTRNMNSELGLIMGLIGTIVMVILFISAAMLGYRVMKVYSMVYKHMYVTLKGFEKEFNREVKKIQLELKD